MPGDKGVQQQVVSPNQKIRKDIGEKGLLALRPSVSRPLNGKLAALPSDNDQPLGRGSVNTRVPRGHTNKGLELGNKIFEEWKDRRRQRQLSAMGEKPASGSGSHSNPQQKDQEAQGASAKWTCSLRFPILPVTMTLGVNIDAQAGELPPDAHPPEESKSGQSPDSNSGSSDFGGSPPNSGSMPKLQQLESSPVQDRAFLRPSDTFVDVPLFAVTSPNVNLAGPLAGTLGRASGSSAPQPSGRYQPAFQHANARKPDTRPLADALLHPSVLSDSSRASGISWQASQPFQSSGMQCNPLFEDPGARKAPALLPSADPSGVPLVRSKSPPLPKAVTGAGAPVRLASCPPFAALKAMSVSPRDSAEFHELQFEMAVASAQAGLLQADLALSPGRPRPASPLGGRSSMPLDASGFGSPTEVPALVAPAVAPLPHGSVAEDVLKGLQSGPANPPAVGSAAGVRTAAPLLRPPGAPALDRPAMPGKGGNATAGLTSEASAAATGGEKPVSEPVSVPAKPATVAPPSADVNSAASKAGGFSAPRMVPKVVGYGGTDGKAKAMGTAPAPGAAAAGARLNVPGKAVPCASRTATGSLPMPEVCMAPPVVATGSADTGSAASGGVFGLDASDSPLSPKTSSAEAGQREPVSWVATDLDSSSVNAVLMHDHLALQKERDALKAQLQEISDRVAKLEKQRSKEGWKVDKRPSRPRPSSVGRSRVRFGPATTAARASSRDRGIRMRERATEAEFEGAQGSRFGQPPQEWQAEDRGRDTRGREACGIGKDGAGYAPQARHFRSASSHAMWERESGWSSSSSGYQDGPRVASPETFPQEADWQEEHAANLAEMGANLQPQSFQEPPIIPGLDMEPEPAVWEEELGGGHQPAGRRRSRSRIPGPPPNYSSEARHHMDRTTTEALQNVVQTLQSVLGPSAFGGYQNRGPSRGSSPARGPDPAARDRGRSPLRRKAPSSQEAVPAPANKRGGEVANRRDWREDGHQKYQAPPPSFCVGWQPHAPSGAPAGAGRSGPRQALSRYNVSAKYDAGESTVPAWHSKEQAPLKEAAASRIPSRPYSRPVSSNPMFPLGQENVPAEANAAGGVRKLKKADLENQPPIQPGDKGVLGGNAERKTQQGAFVGFSGSLRG